MGLKTKLINDGSLFTYGANGTTTLPYLEAAIIPINPLATNASKLHATQGSGGTTVLPGFSLGNASNAINEEVNSNAALYNNGAGTLLPLSPFGLDDLNGTNPTIANHGTVGESNANTFSTQALPYLQNLPT